MATTDKSRPSKIPLKDRLPRRKLYWKPVPPHLGSLPGELLNRIFTYAAAVDEPIAAFSFEAGMQRVNEPALATVCNRFRPIALQNYYAENTFKFPSKRPLIVNIQHAQA